MSPNSLGRFMYQETYSIVCMYCINRELKNGIRSLDSFIDVVFLSVDKFYIRKQAFGFT